MDAFKIVEMLQPSVVCLALGFAVGWVAAYDEPVEGVMVVGPSLVVPLQLPPTDKGPVLKTPESPAVPMPDADDIFDFDLDLDLQEQSQSVVNPFLY